MAVHDLCCHGERFVSPATMAPEAEAASMALAVESLTRTVGRPPLGWQSRYSPSDATRALLVEHGGFLYDADSHADDLSYWVRVGERPHLVVPHGFIHNDNRLTNGRLGTGEDFLAHLLAALRVLHGEGGRMMTVSLNGRVSGQPSRFDAVRRFLDAVAGLEGVWCAGRSAVARLWIATHPAEARGPLIPGALAHLDCDTHAVLEGGDHLMLAGRVRRRGSARVERGRFGGGAKNNQS